MTYDEYLVEIGRIKRLNPNWHIGQTAFNVLISIRPDLAQRVRLTQIDPYHFDERLAAFYSWVYAHWDEESTQPEDTELFKNYSRALDEIYQLRAALAYEAFILYGHLELKTFPKSRRNTAQQQLVRMRMAARGLVRNVYTNSYTTALVAAGAKQTLTRSQWEDESSQQVGEET